MYSARHSLGHHCSAGIEVCVRKRSRPGGPYRSWEEVLNLLCVMGGS